MRQNLTEILGKNDHKPDGEASSMGKQSLPHHCKWSWTVEPDLKCECSLVEKHSQPIRPTRPDRGGIIKQSGSTARVDRIVYQQVRMKVRSWNDWPIAAIHSEGGSIDEDIGIFQLPSKVSILERDCTHTIERP